MINEFNTIIGKTKLFQGIELGSIGSLLKCLDSRLKEYDKNNIILVEDEEVVELSLILSGKVCIVKEKANGERSIISILSSGDVFGESIIFTTKKRSLVSVIALDEVEIVSINVNKIIDTCSESCIFHKKLILNIMEILAEKNIMLNKKIEYLSLKGMREKLSNYLFNQYKIFKSETFSIDFNRNELAEYLNVSRASMSRELSRMKEEEIIDYNKNEFKIINLEKIIKNI